MILHIIIFFIRPWQLKEETIGFYSSLEPFSNRVILANLHWISIFNFSQFAHFKNSIPSLPIFSRSHLVTYDAVEVKLEVTFNPSNQVDRPTLWMDIFFTALADELWGTESVALPDLRKVRKFNQRRLLIVPSVFDRDEVADELYRFCQGKLLSRSREYLGIVWSFTRWKRRIQWKTLRMSIWIDDLLVECRNFSKVAGTVRRVPKSWIPLIPLE